jgi:BRCT domain type II-containing protein
MSMVTPKTDFLVADEEMGPAKYDRCKRYEIPILSEEEFLLRLSEAMAL